jgi:hypothetical protein
MWLRTSPTRRSSEVRRLGGELIVVRNRSSRSIQFWMGMEPKILDKPTHKAPQRIGRRLPRLSDLFFGFEASDLVEDILVQLKCV